MIRISKLFVASGDDHDAFLTEIRWILTIIIRSYMWRHLNSADLRCHYRSDVFQNVALLLNAAGNIVNWVGLSTADRLTCTTGDNGWKVGFAGIIILWIAALLSMVATVYEVRSPSILSNCSSCSFLHMALVYPCC
jgi:hypothetical protein